MRRILISFLICLVMVSFVYAKTLRGTASEAVAMVEKAVNYIIANGQEKAFKEISNPKGQFVDRDLYVYVVNMNGIILAHGGDPSMVGKNYSDVRDMDGKPFIRDLIRQAKVKKTGWFDYKWPHPITKEIEPRSEYYQRIGDLVVCCGIYYSTEPFET